MVSTERDGVDSGAAESKGGMCVATVLLLGEQQLRIPDGGETGVAAGDYY